MLSSLDKYVKHVFVTGPEFSNIFMRNLGGISVQQGYFFLFLWFVGVHAG